MKPMRETRSTAAALTWGAVALLALTGCTGGQAPDGSGTTNGTTSTQTGSPSTPAPTQTTEPAPAPIALPECEAMNATIQGESDAFYALQGDAGVTAHRGEVDLTIFDETVGPAAREAMAQATQVRGCTWPVHYHNVVTQYTAQIPEAARDALIAALRESVYVESTEGPAIRFDHTEPGEPSPVVTIDTDIAYLFVGDAWIAIMGNGELDYGPGALDGLFAVNPGLAP